MLRLLLFISSLFLSMFFFCVFLLQPVFHHFGFFLFLFFSLSGGIMPLVAVTVIILSLSPSFHISYTFMCCSSWFVLPLVTVGVIFRRQNHATCFTYSFPPLLSRRPLFTAIPASPRSTPTHISLQNMLNSHVHFSRFTHSFSPFLELLLCFLTPSHQLPRLAEAPVSPDGMYTPQSSLLSQP